MKIKLIKILWCANRKIDFFCKINKIYNKKNHLNPLILIYFLSKKSIFLWGVRFFIAIIENSILLNYILFINKIKSKIIII